MDVIHEEGDFECDTVWMGSQCSCFSVGVTLGLRYFVRRARVVTND